VHFHPEKPTVLETDASDFAVDAVLSQVQETKRLHPVAYHSRKPAKINYDVHDKEMLAIVTAFKEWEHMLKSVAGAITVYTDHKNLEYFATSKVLTRRQARWSEHLAEFNFKVITDPARKTRKMCDLGVGTTPLKRGVKPPQSAFSRLFRSPSRSDGFWSPSGSNEKRRRRPSGFDGQNCRDSERGIRGYRRFKLSAAAGRHSHTVAPMQICGWC
jgi:hypothetical protein